MSDLYKLPKGWRWELLDNLTDVNIGKTPSRSKSQYFRGDKIWLSIRDLKGDYVSESNEKITDEAIKDSNIKIVKKGTLLMSFKLTLGRTAFADCDLYTNEAIASLPIKDESKLNKYFLNYSIGVINLEKEVDNAVKGKTLNKQKIKNLDIPLPPLSEQQRIVSKLDLLFEKIDKSIALHQKNIDEANFFMGSVLNDVFGELEEKYGLIEVGKITDCIVPQRNKPKQFIGNIQWITTDDLRLFKRISKSTKGLGLRREDIEEVKAKTFPKESVLMSCVGDLGIVAIADDEIVVNQQLHTYQCKDNLLNTFLMYALYVKKDFMYYIANITTVAYMNKSKCNSIPIPLPPLNIQQKTVKYLDEITKKVEKIKEVQKEKMNNLKALKASILDRAFKGEL